MDDCRARLDRFEKLLDALDHENGLYVKERPYEVLPEFDPNTGWHTIYLRTKPLDPIFGILVGEAAHELRAVLDNIAWQLANLDGPPGQPNKVQFPIMTREPKNFAASPYVNGMRPEHVAVLESLQPYVARKTGQVPLGKGTRLEELAWINNTDKHKVVHATASLAEDVAPSLLHAYQGYRLAGFEFVEGRIVLEGKTYIGKVCIRPTQPQLQMHMHGEIDVGVAFGDRGSPLFGVPADGGLRLLKQVVEHIIEALDRPGASGVPPWP